MLSTIPEDILWFVKNERFSPKQGRNIVYSIIGIHVIFSIVFSYIVLHKLNVFTIFLFTLLVLFGAILGKKEIYHWFPIYLFLALYDMLSVFQEIFTYGFAVNFYGFDTFFFGWMFNGQPPSYYFYEHHIAFFDVFFGVFYVIHVIFPPMIILYLRVYHEDKFDRMAWSSLFLGIVSILFYLFMPTLPPWYTYNYGFGSIVSTQLTIQTATAGVWYTDQILGTAIFSKIMWNLTSAKFAAFPSMHVGAPSYMYFSCRKAKIKKITPILLIYTILIFFGVIYLNHHWVADALGGLILAWLSVKLSNRLYGDNYKIGQTKELKSEVKTTSLVIPSK